MKQRAHLLHGYTLACTSNRPVDKMCIAVHARSNTSDENTMMAIIYGAKFRQRTSNLVQNVERLKISWRVRHTHIDYKPAFVSCACMYTTIVYSV